MDTSESASRPAGAPRRGSGLARRTYLPRTVGLGIGSLCAGAGLHQAGAPAWVWGVMLVYCFAWPHVALRISLRSASPYAAERRNLMVDSFAGGVWPVAMAFNLLPSVLLLAALAMNNFATGGAKLFGKGVLAHLAGAAMALLLVGPKFLPETSFMTVLLCVPFLLSYPLVLGVVMYRLSIELSRRKDELVLEKRRADEANLTQTRVLAELAARDALTGLFNRRHMSELLAQHCAASQRSGGGFAVALVDLDHFKRINDSHGHAVGDSVLRAFAEQAGAAMRGTDTVGRWGGEEFLVIYPCSSADEAAQGAARLLEQVAAAAVTIPGGETLTFTVSIGLTGHAPPESVDALVERADRAMYQAKSQGRNRVVTLPEGAGKA
ncbi:MULTISPECIES: sensor domain-containing diguanylate cyclase [unclassified Roseateles]|uniref:sensor domain-containing diguanylate cyclase n=1 Tax=unclassified Roseateles TaxID=2626991 RepID=UPI0006F4457F|nr:MULTISPECIES: sensor domain-containing diguanylate cyclase [unclassified Roseateles]